MALAVLGKHFGLSLNNEYSAMAVSLLIISFAHSVPCRYFKHGYMKPNLSNRILHWYYDHIPKP